MVYPIGCTEDNPVVIFVAHSDVVFPDTDPLPLKIEDGRIYCPGVGDDTANAVALLMAAKYIANQQLAPKKMGVVLCINSGEEGLGNLKGTRKLMETYAGRVQEFIAFDAGGCSVTNKAVGSHRYRIEIDTEGGHSYGAFGNRNAIAYLASLIDTLYTVKVPEKGKTTYNVGTISGGTSVNTIAQHAEMLYEYRSDEKEALEVMEKHLMAALEFYRAKGVQVKSTLVGNRPCSGNVDQARQEALESRVSSVLMKHIGQPASFKSGSTDCNIPLSQGIPAVSMGCKVGGKAHTREEYVEIDSLLPGLKIAFDMVLSYFA
ncbi:MAG: M20/M25/M40 family metallo-hydrolase [Clostridiales bacterium]|nr:M20/M25/M40 family metallo-hydrolase [Clostridiales bacterium]